MGRFTVGVLLVLSGAVAWCGPAAAGDGPVEKAARSWRENPRLGGSLGRLRKRISRHPQEFVETPDVVTLKDGRKLEAYWLEVYGDWFVFYVKETGRSWLKEEVPRSDVARVQFDTYLDRDPVEPAVIRVARKQPVRKDEILSGVFTGLQGRYTKWKITFRSEIDKYHVHSEDATEYGVVKLESAFEQNADKTRFAHAVRASGRYFLYAPGTVNNKDWVLVLSEIVHSEVDRSPDVMFATESLAAETFILYFSRDRNRFELAWSNIGNWSWTPLVKVTFRRVPDARPAAGSRYHSEPWRGDRRSIERPAIRRARPPAPDRSSPARPPARELRRVPDSRPLVASSGEGRAAPSRSSQQRRAGGTRRSGIGNWGGPVTYWSRRQ